MSKKKRTRFPWSGLGYGPVDFEKTYIWYNLVTIIYSEIGGALMNGFECMLIEYLQRTQGQETVKTLQQKASWSRVGLGLKWQVQNISTLSK